MFSKLVIIGELGRSLLNTKYPTVRTAITPKIAPKLMPALDRPDSPSFVLLLFSCLPTFGALVVLTFGNCLLVVKIEYLVVGPVFPAVDPTVVCTFECLALYVYNQD